MNSLGNNKLPNSFFLCPSHQSLVERVHYAAMNALENSVPSLQLTPPKSLMRPVGRAIKDFDMIREGDRILVGVSGGKDSLSLLHILHHLQSYAPVRFELAALTVDPQVEGFDPSTLKAYMAEIGIPYFYQSSAIEKRAKEQMGNSCHFTRTSQPMCVSWLLHRYFCLPIHLSNRVWPGS